MLKLSAVKAQDGLPRSEHSSIFHQYFWLCTQAKSPQAEDEALEPAGCNGSSTAASSSATGRPGQTMTDAYPWYY